MRDKIRVLFLHSQTGFGADSAIHGELMRCLDRKRFAVHLACGASDGSGPSVALSRFRLIPDVRLRPTTFAPGFRQRSRDEVMRGIAAAAGFPVELLKLAAYVRRERIDVIHGTDRPRDAVYTVGLGRITGAKSVVHVHVAWSRGYSAPARWGVRNADSVFCISEFVARTVVLTGTSRSRVHTVLNGIDLGRWDPQTDGEPVRRELGIPQGAPLVVSVSRLFRHKGQRELVQALARVARTVPEVRLVIVGADAVEVHGGSFTAELRALAADLGLSERVLFTGPRSDVPRIMAACDLFALPSHEEPFGLVFVEAMAMQRPVVALTDGGAPEVVEHGHTGLLSRRGDVEGLAQNIAALLRDPTLRAKMGSQGRARAERLFTAERMARDAERGYEALVGA